MEETNSMQGILLEQKSWKEAERLLTENALIVIPLGSACKEHGFHLQLNNDFILVEYLKNEVLKNADVIVLPTVNYSYYPAFIEYPGSVSLSEECTLQMFCDISRSISKFGPKRFYVLNTGISTIQPLQKAAEILVAESILFAYTNLEKALSARELSGIEEQEGGSHADEIETSIMLHIAPESVNMDLAACDFDKNARGRLTRDREQANVLSYSESGVWGNAKLANQAKGQKVVKCLVEQILLDIAKLKASSLPAGFKQ